MDPKAQFFVGDESNETIECFNNIRTYENKIHLMDLSIEYKMMVVQQKFNKLREETFTKRDEIINKIPYFWRIVFTNHPTLCTFFGEDLLFYLRNFKLAVSNTLERTYSIHFYFNENSYFTNDILTKYIHFGNTDNNASEMIPNQIPIQWKQDFALEELESTYSRKRKLTKEGFFNWFQGNQSFNEDPIAKLLKDDLWLDPLQYFFLPEEKKCVITKPRNFNFYTNNNNRNFNENKDFVEEKMDFD